MVPCSPGEGSKQLIDNEGKEMYDEPLASKSSMQLLDNMIPTPVRALVTDITSIKPNRWAGSVHRGCS